MHAYDEFPAEAGARVVEAHPRPVEAGTRRSDLGGHVRQTHREVGQSHRFGAPQIEDNLIVFKIKYLQAKMSGIINNFRHISG